MEKFVIAWLLNGNVCYLELPEGEGPRLAENGLADATEFDTYEEGFAVFLQYKDALGALDGAVLQPGEVSAQFDETKPCPRIPFNLTADAVQQQMAGTLEALSQAQGLAEANARQARTLKIEVDRLTEENRSLRDAATNDLA